MKRGSKRGGGGYRYSVLKSYVVDAYCEIQSQWAGATERAIKTPKKFRKIHIAAGEEKKISYVCFNLCPSTK